MRDLFDDEVGESKPHDSLQVMKRARLAPREEHDAQVRQATCIYNAEIERLKTKHVGDVMDQSKLLWLLTLLSANLQVHFAARQPSCRRVVYNLPIVTAIAAAK